jgi:hypothetical protein
VIACVRFSFFAPTISSGFGTSPSIAANNGTAIFEINVGTGGTANTGTIGLPTAPNGWGCIATDQTSSAMSTQQKSNSTTSVEANYNSSGGTKNWNASDILIVHCWAF